VREVVPPKFTGWVIPSRNAAAVRARDPAIARLGSDDAGARTARTLILVDTSPGQDFREGTARLGTDARNPQTYVAGALLLNGSRLMEVYRDYIVLERDGQSARLYVQGKAPKGEPESALTVVGAAYASRPSDAPSAYPVSSGDTRTAAVNTYIRPNPVFDAEQLRGFAVYPGGQSGEFVKLGLQPGDVITAINGVGVTDGDQFMDALEQVTAGEVVEATIERRGSTQHVTLDGSAIGTRE